MSLFLNLTKYAMRGPTSGQLLTQRGKILTHDNRAELEFLFPNVEVVRCGAPSEECLPIRFARGTSHYRFPLRRSDFKDPR